jgi:hypothetical protein
MGPGVFLRPDRMVGMSCVAAIRSTGQYGEFPPLPMSRPKWTQAKRNRLESFAASTDPRLRAIAAAHPLSSKGVLGRMISDPDVGVRRAAIKNPRATDAMIEVALVDRDPGIAAFARLLRTEDTDD